MGNRFSANYLFRNPRSSNYFFRMRVPAAFKEVACLRELRYSLQTADLTEAKYRALHLMRYAEGVFRKFSRKVFYMVELNKETIEKLMKEELDRYLNEAEEMRATAIRPITRERLESQEFGLWSSEGDARAQLALKDNSQIARYVDEFLKERKISDVSKGSVTYGILCREFLKMNIKLHDIELRRIIGDYSDTPEINLASEREPKESTQVLDQVLQSPLLSSVIHEYMEEGQKSGIWKPKTTLEVKTSLDVIKEILGDKPVSEITSITMRDFKKVLMKLPPNVHKSPIYRDKSLEEIIAMDVAKTMSITTVNKQLDRASTLFKWAVRNGYMDRNPAEGMQLKLNKRDDEYRAVLTPDDLKKIFNSPEYLYDTHRFGYRFWLPVIALFTGMRINEICQLHLDDVYKDTEGVYVFDIGERKGKTDTKTKSSERLVPLHDILLDLNLPGYLHKLRTEGQTRLFPDLIKGRDGYGKKASRWYADYRKKCGIIDGPEGKKDFHAFRHTVTNTLKQANAEHFATQELLGHSTGSITFSRYGKRYTPRFLKEHVLDLLKYDVDLSLLKSSKYVVG